MIGFLKTYKTGETWQWQREGHYANVKFAANYSPTIRLLPFFIYVEKTGTAIAEINAIKCFPLERSVGVKDLKKIDISAIGMTKVSGIYKNKWYYLANTDIIGITEGYWYIKVKFDNDDEHFTDLIYVPNENEIISCMPDFNNDFNNDFLIC